MSNAARGCADAQEGKAPWLQREGTEGKSSAGGFLLLWEDNLSVWRLERGGSALWGTELKTEVLSASMCSIFAPGPSTASVYSPGLNFLALLPHSQILLFFFFFLFFPPLCLVPCLIRLFYPDLSKATSSLERTSKYSSGGNDFVMAALENSRVQLQGKSQGAYRQKCSAGQRTSDLGQ